MANPGEYTMRAYLNGKMDLSQAEAVADLIASTNKATHQMAMSQLRGGISTKLSQLRDQLLKLTSLLELELDFSDHEDLGVCRPYGAISLAQKIDNHITHLANPSRPGKPQKGHSRCHCRKHQRGQESTLLNRLLKDERAIVSDIHGTTRDTIEDNIDIKGITFRFIDTAGIRQTTDQVEQIGIERSVIAAIQRARIIVMMTEPGVPYPDIDVRDDQTVIRNKSINFKTDAFQAKFGVGIEALEATSSKQPFPPCFRL